MKVVLDTDVVVAAMRSPTGGAAELIRSIVQGRPAMLLTVALALEYEAQCTSAEHVLAAGLRPRQAEDFVTGLIALAEPVQYHFRWRPQLRDPGDELVLEAAVNGRANAIVTFNERDLRAARDGFGIEVIRPGEVLRRLRS